MSNAPLRLFSLLGCAFVAACSSADPYAGNRLTLQTASEQIAAGQWGEAGRALEGVIADTNASADQFLLQRYFAAYLLGRARLEAALHARGDEALGDLVATSYYANFAQEWSAAAKGSKAKGEAGQPLLPEGLEAYGVDKAQAYLDLAWVILCARTKFQGEVADVIAREPRLANVESAEQLSVELGMSDQLRPWLLWGLFDYFKGPNEPLAYKFGIRARELGRKVPQVFPRERGEEIVHWIQHGSKFVFKSSAGVEFDPGAEVCSQTGEPNITYQSHPRQ